MSGQRLGGSQQDGVVGVCLDVLLQILGTLEGLAAEIALVGLERNMHANVGGDMVALNGGGSAGAPLTLQVEVVGGLAANMAFTDMIL